MSTEDQRAYNRGYAAGRKRRARDGEEERRRARIDAFFLRAMLVALPACMTMSGWKNTKANGEQEPITNLDQRTELARKFARKATELAIEEGRL